MIEAKITYSFKDEKSFKDKVIPYIYGGGIFHKEKTWVEEKGNIITLSIKVKNLSQLITVSTGMLRYSQESQLDKVEIVKIENSPKKNNLKFGEKPLIGIILKPSLDYKPEIAKRLIEWAVKNKLDFIKDDDASEYSKEEAKQIKILSSEILYFQKISNKSSMISNNIMVVPWVNGCSLGKWLEFSRRDK